MAVEREVGAGVDPQGPVQQVQQTDRVLEGVSDREQGGGVELPTVFVMFNASHIHICIICKFLSFNNSNSKTCVLFCGL